MLDGPMWGLTEDQDSQIHLKVLLCILRVPGVFFLDIFWHEHLHKIFLFPKSLELNDLADYGWDLVPLVLAVFFLLLPLCELVDLYMHLISGAALGLSVFSAHHFAEEEITRPGARTFGPDYIKNHVTNGASCIVITRLIRWCLSLQHPVFREVCPQLYLLPLCASFLGASPGLVSWLTTVMHGFMALSAGTYGLRVAAQSLLYLHCRVMDYSAIRAELGFGAMVVVIRRMLEPQVLALYWTVQLLAQVWSDVLGLEDKKYIIQDSDWMVESVVTLSEVCYSPLMLIAFCIVVMLVSRAVLCLTQLALAQFANVAGAGQPVLPSGVTEGIVTFVLGLQTGMTDLEMPARVGAVSIILFVVVASLLQSCLELTHPVLLSLPAVHRRVSRHLVPVAITLVLLAAPLWMVHCLLTKISSDMWTLVIISSCLVTAVQSLGHLVTYAIIVWDCGLAQPSPHTDDYIFWVKAATKFGELLLAVAVVGGGFYESFVQDEEKDWSMMNSLVLISHCYFNIYCRVSQGWSSYLARRKTSQRLSSLKVATEAQLKEHGDVCSICYMEMDHPTAVITECQHFFHQHCLKKWLVVQDNCPLCSKPVVADEEQEAARNEDSDDGVTDFEDEEEDQRDETSMNSQTNQNQEHLQDQDQLAELRRRISQGQTDGLRIRLNPTLNLFEGD